MTSVRDFEDQRQHLNGLAYRLLGSVSDAEDMVQETFLRWRESGQPSLAQPRAWFTKTCTRLCLDRLKSAQRRRESYVGVWLPEPLVSGEGVEESHELDESLSVALLFTIERLRPAERAAFLLHDVFGYEFSEVAEILGLGAANCRQLASRARRHLAGGRPAQPADRATVRRLSDAFFQAIESGDLDGLRAVLAEDVVLRTDGGGKAAAAKRPIEGAPAVVRFFARIFIQPTRRPRIEARAWTFNGAPGTVLYEAGRPVSAFHFRVDGGRIVGIYVHRNPDKLTGFQLR